MMSYGNFRYMLSLWTYNLDIGDICSTRNDLSMAHDMAIEATPDSKVYGANVGPIWGRQDPGGPHVGPMNFAIWDVYQTQLTKPASSLWKV